MNTNYLQVVEDLFRASCKTDCKCYNDPWPKHMRKASCRLATEWLKETNPVSKCVINEILENRKMNGEDISIINCPFEQEKRLHK